MPGICCRYSLSVCLRFVSRALAFSKVARNKTHPHTLLPILLPLSLLYYSSRVSFFFPSRVSLWRLSVSRRVLNNSLRWVLAVIGVLPFVSDHTPPSRGAWFYFYVPNDIFSNRDYTLLLALHGCCHCCRAVLITAWSVYRAMMGVQKSSFIYSFSVEVIHLYRTVSLFSPYCPPARSLPLVPPPPSCCF